MIKKIILTLCLMSIGLSCLADENDYLVVRGFQNLEKIQKLDVINKLSAIADNDGVEFSEKWPAEYFKDSGNKTYADMIHSTRWANKRDSTFEYKTNTSGSTATKPSGTKLKIPSGSAEATKTNNIYDLEGNVLDYTMEYAGYEVTSTGITYIGRITRGGEYSYSRRKRRCR